MILAFLYSQYLCRLLPQCTGMTCATDKILQKWQLVISEAGWLKVCALQFTFSWIIHCGKNQLPCCKDTQRPYGSQYMVRNWSLFPKAKTNQPLVIWMSHPGCGSSSPSHSYPLTFTKAIYQTIILLKKKIFTKAKWLPKQPLSSFGHRDQILSNIWSKSTTQRLVNCLESVS